MRFSTRDLMGVTALAAFYAAGASTLLGANSMTGVGFVLGVVVFVGFFGAVAAAFNAISTSIRAGVAILTVWTPQSWRSHLLVAGVFAGLATLVASALGGDAALAAYGLLSGVTVHVFLLVNARITFCDHAVIAAGRIRTWKRCQFEVISSDDNHWLAIQTPWYKRNQRVCLPRNRVEEVQRVLAEKQPPIDAKRVSESVHEYQLLLETQRR